MKKILHYLDEYLEEFLMVIFLIAMTLIMGIQVFSRYILGMSLSWSEEITRYLFIWSAFLSVSLCTRKCISIKIDQAAPFVCFIITAFRIVQRWFGEWKIVLKKDEKPLEEGSIASVIEEAVVEDTYREKELVEDIEAIHSKAEKRKEK